MKYPNFNEEKKLWKRGYKVVVGLDEAGRGPLAGPVVAAAVALNPNIQTPRSNQITKSTPKKVFKVSQKWDFIGYWALGLGISEVKDSKKMMARQREEVYKVLIKHPQVTWGVGIVSEKIIDKINILEATKLAMKKAVKNLDADFLLIDGNFRLNVDLPQKSIIKGDQKVFSISAASIIAKVTRDRIMEKYHKKYPQYGFDKHKGYGTKAHFASIEKFGPCKIHRKTFWPIWSTAT